MANHRRGVVEKTQVCHSIDFAKTAANLTSGINMKRVITVKAQADWDLDITFSDEMRGTISIKDRLFGPIFEPLKDPALFAQVSIDEFGVICWPNGADLAPDGLYEKLKKSSRVA
jgi:hypothetical protein